jgi:uncharacterized protein YbjT (DUF2867 family)
MSAMGAHSGNTPIRRLEQALERSGLRYNIIRPNTLMQYVDVTRVRDAVRVPVPQRAVSMVDARDVAAVAARLLMNDEHDNRAFDVTGPCIIGPEAVARIVSQVTGRAAVCDSVIVPPLLDRTTTAVRELLGREPTRFEDYAKACRCSLLRAA